MSTEYLQRRCAFSFCQNAAVRDGYCRMHLDDDDDVTQAAAQSDRGTESEAWKPPHDAPKNMAWCCPDCDSWATLNDNALAHQFSTKHGRPQLRRVPSPEQAESSTEGQVRPDIRGDLIDLIRRGYHVLNMFTPAEKTEAMFRVLRTMQDCIEASYSVHPSDQSEDVREAHRLLDQEIANVREYVRGTGYYGKLGVAISASSPLALAILASAQSATNHTSTKT